MSAPTIEAPVEAPVILSPAEAAGPIEGEIVLKGKMPGGILTIDPDQSKFTDRQIVALQAIGIDRSFPDAQIWSFLHLCQSRGLDPWAKEAYLIRRGKGDNTKYTMQTGIDGYLKLANDTGRFIRVAGTYWTGNDDDANAWRWDPVEEVMRRMWFDQWPASRGYPGAARAVIEYVDSATKSIVRSDGVAHWDMYAPMMPKWAGPKGNRHPVMVNGAQVMELSEMWEKGYHHMIGKCSRALALRTAFPRETSGIYTHEEMHALDAAERVAQEQDRKNGLRAAYEASQEQRRAKAAAPQQRESVTLKAEAQRVDQSEREKGEPEQLKDIAQQFVADAKPEGMPVEAPGPEDVSAGPMMFKDEPEPDEPVYVEPTPVECLAELELWAKLYGKNLKNYLVRTLAAAQVENPEDLTHKQLLEQLDMRRPYTVTKLREQNYHGDADACERGELIHPVSDDR